MTKLPKLNSEGSFIRTETGIIVAHVGYSNSDANEKAIAAELCRRSNCHEALVEALNRALAASDPEEDWDDIAKTIQDALALARETDAKGR